MGGDAVDGGWRKDGFVMFLNPFTRVSIILCQWSYRIYY